MRIANTQKATALRTGLNFEVIDMRGRSGFPNTQEGFVFKHRYFTIRTDHRNQGWRIDRYNAPGLCEAVYGPGRQSYFKTSTKAADALQGHLRG